MKPTALLILAIAAAALPSQAALSLVSENFQDPTLSNNTSNPSFAGWTYTNSARTFSRLETNDSALAGDTDYTTNQALYFEYNDEANYVLTHTWSATDVYTLTFNAAGTAWEQTKDRWVRPRILQGDGTVLWDPGDAAQTYITPWVVGTDGAYVWNGPGLYGNSTWQAEPDTQFSFTINAADFITGTEGETITLQLDTSGQRGVYFDNIELSLIPEPATALLSSLGVLLLLRRRRA